MLIDCDRCLVRELECADCVVTFLLGSAGHPDLSGDELAAVAALAGEGVVPPLRLQLLPGGNNHESDKSDISPGSAIASR